MNKKERYVILYEDMLSRFGIIAEGHQVLREMLQRNTEELRQEIRDTNMMMRCMINALSEKIDNTKEGLTVEIKSVREDLTAEIGNVRRELGAEIGNVRRELGAEIGNVRRELGAEIKSVEQKLGGKIDSIAEGIDNHETRIFLLEKAA